MLFISPQKLFILKIFKFLPWLFDHVSKRLIKKIKVDFKIHDVRAWSTNNCNMYIAQYFQSILYSNVPQKTTIRYFYNQFLHKHLFRIPLWRETDNITSLFLISRKNLKAVYLSFHWFNDSGTRGFEPVTCRLELVTRGFELALLKFNSCF